LLGRPRLEDRVLVVADGGAFGPPGKIPEIACEPSVWAWVRIGGDGRNALYANGWARSRPGCAGPAGPPGLIDAGQSGSGPGQQVTRAIGNYKDPILKPWAAEQMRISNEEVLTGKRGMPFLATSRCYPGAVPGQLLWTTGAGCSSYKNRDGAHGVGARLALAPHHHDPTSIPRS